MDQPLKLTKKDRANILSLAAIYDAWVEGHQRNPHQTINLNRDVDQLLNYGFEYGISRTSLFGVDRDGVSWQVCVVDSGRSHNGGRFGTTTWYKIDQRGLRHKVIPGLKWQDFYELFGGKRKT